MTKIFLILLFLMTHHLYGLEIHKLDIRCESTHTNCKDFIRKSVQLVGGYENIDLFKKILSFFISDYAIEKFKFELEELDNKNILRIDVKFKRVIGAIKFKFNQSLNLKPLFINSLKSKEGLAYQEDILFEDMKLIKEKLFSMGFLDLKIESKIDELNSHVIDIIIDVDSSGTSLLDEISYDCKSLFIQPRLKKTFGAFKGKIFSREQAAILINEQRRELTDLGYYNLKLNYNLKKNKKDYLLSIKCEDEDLSSFEFIDTKDLFKKEDLGKDIASLFTRLKDDYLVKEIEKSIGLFYSSKGYLNPETNIQKIGYKTNFNEQAVRFKVTVNPGLKTKVFEVVFRGNVFWNRDKLIKLYKKNASDLASVNYYDPAYYESFINILKEKYIEQGYLDPEVNYYSKQGADQRVSVYFDINEGNRTVLESFSIQHEHGQNFHDQLILNHFSLRQNQPFNPIQFTAEYEQWQAKLKEEGYYFLEAIDDKDEQVVRYSPSKQSAYISLKYKLGPVVKIDRIFVIGVLKTNEDVVLRKLNLSREDILTPSLIDLKKTELASLAIFSSVDISPVRHQQNNAYVDLIVKVREKDYGLVEISPGFRTDLGLKLDSRITWMNLFGENHTATLNATLNQRLSLDQLDSTRRDQDKKILEYDLRFGYSLPDLLKTYWDYSHSTSFATKRFYSFDADILRISNMISRDFLKHYSFSLRHQYEAINQYNATLTSDNGDFTIGAITPGFTMDFRDNQILPHRGAHFNISCEIAKPAFLSENSKELVIDYYKLIARNKFYIPIGDLTLAISLATGVQKNLSTDIKYQNGIPLTDTDGVILRNGYIPSIKVFRLAGTDTVRGFGEDEINRVESGQDISEVLVQDKAYMTNIKIEPRYSINDQLTVGLFLDAGRLQLGKYDPFDLRSSVGLSFKFLTPVGTLDFDYGIKLLRKKMPDGSLESPGRLHLSIGFF